ncbi:hypothetical protein V2J09_001217 [Rumex salicifolius]
MRVSAIRSVCRFQLARFQNFMRPSSYLALACLNSASSDSSSDEQTPFVPENYSNLSYSVVAWDNRDVAELLHSYRRDPKQALSLFYELKGRGFQHNLETYIGIIRVVCEHGMGRKLETLLSEIMNLGEMVLGFGMSELIEALFKRLESEGESSMLVRALGELVKACASLGMYEEAIDLLFQTRKGLLPCILSCNYLLNRLIEENQADTAMHVYQRLERLGLSPNVYTNNILLKAYCKKGSLIEAFNLVDKMEQDGVLNEFTLTTLIEGLCLQGEADSGYKVLKSCRENKVPLAIFAYAVVIRGFCAEMKLDRAEEVLWDIESQGLIPDVYCFSALIHAHYKCGNFDKVLNLHDAMVMKGVKTNCVVVSSVLQSLCSMEMTSEAADCFQYFNRSGIYLDKISYNVMLDALCKTGKMDEAEELFNQMESGRIAPDVIHYSTLINGYCLAGNLHEASRVFEVMIGKGLEPDVVSYNILVGACCRHGDIKYAEDLVELMQKQGLKLDSVMYKVMIKGLFVSEKIEEAEALFSRVEDKSLDLYFAMVNGYCEVNYTSKAYDLFCMLSKQGISVNKKCCVRLLNCLLKAGEYEKAVFMFKNSPLLEISPCIKTCSRLISSLCEAGMLRTAREIFDDWIQRRLETDIIMYTIMINGYCNSNYMREAYDLFNDMEIRGMKPDIVTYTVVIDGRLNSCLKKTSQYSNDVQSKELVRSVSPLLQKMEKETISLDVVCYTVLIDKHCKLLNIQDAVKLFNEMIEKGLKPDNVAYSALLSAYCRSGYDKEAWILVDKMVDNGFHRSDIIQWFMYELSSFEMALSTDSLTVLEYTTLEDI